MEHSSGTQFLFQHWTPCQPSQPEEKNEMHRWEQEKKIQQEHQEFLQQSMQIPQEKEKNTNIAITL
jgi:hypothetical protein